MESSNKKYQVYCILLIAILSASLGYAMGLNDREDYLQQQEQQKIEQQK